MNRAPIETPADLQHVKQAVLYPVLIDVLERDMRTLDTLQLKMPRVYISSLRRTQEQIHADLVHVRRQLQRRGIKIYEMKRTSQGLEACYVCRGYHRHFSMLWSLVRTEAERRLAAYMQGPLADQEQA
ncbi:hypothetical protein DUZ99_12735 [Xylanibacillus composti]|uniref:Uncharacterized protein n=1 Tax=Xylanibacillus composti TaxID=1572762 RepID=A0A8J4H1H6_9BACL|nr:hypothetical protein [Xylanibacillus composti]MDT9725838.1 hypothetical protein [Xylanibacillus composti]GIQ69208.1 hypothetical protein XYCOK13_20320 [Xylanibacillus composti]